MYKETAAEWLRNRKRKAGKTGGPRKWASECKSILAQALFNGEIDATSTVYAGAMLEVLRQAGVPDLPTKANAIGDALSHLKLARKDGGWRIPQDVIDQWMATICGPAKTEEVASNG